MPTALDRYILSRILVTSCAIIAVSLVALLLERLLRLLDLAANPDRIVGYLSQMLITLIPHYLGVALPLAFFLGVLLTFSRLNRDSELAVIAASGIGLRRLMAPVMVLALVLTLTAAATFSYLQPLARYAYRSLKHAVANASLTAALKERTFVHVDGRTFIAEGTTGEGEFLDLVFLYELTEAGGSVVTTAVSGGLRSDGSARGSTLVLSDGERTEIPPGGDEAKTLAFSQLTSPVDEGEVTGIRPRGEDERELTLPELWVAKTGPPLPGIRPREIDAELNGRLVAVLTIMVLPLLAVPLALGDARRGQSYGLAVGLILVVVYEKVVRLGESMADNGDMGVVPALWVPFFVFALLSVVLWLRAAYTVPNRGEGPLSSVFRSVTQVWRLFDPRDGRAT